MSGIGPTGHTNTVYGGKGGYCSGKIIFPYNQSVFVYVGQSGEETIERTFNGGGAAANMGEPRSGGGATDIRLVDENGAWNNFNSLKSRIMVAAGGGGGSHYHTGCNGGYAGGLSGQNGFYSVDPSYTGATYSVATGATQTSGGKGGIGENSSPDGTFGIGGNGNVSFSGGSSWGSGGGSGYYGGGGGGVNRFIVGSGSGGSSFISGYSGCDAIAESSTEGHIIHTGQANHYSGKVFTNSVMIDGGSAMPSPSGGTETGH
ncbi:glycine rich domain-containing protein, partial [Segatella albensis]|uniref:glycine rich domain-containing protein n=1 Tax=Segatella albensis TaxID=77768 RepID=UPI0004690BA1